jgi:hypothetical protein
MDRSLFRFAAAVLAVAIALNVAWCLVQPVLPALLVLFVLLVLLAGVHWFRSRW